MLLLRSIDPHFPEAPFWVTPGGGVEADEDVEAAARRELAEETGCTTAQLGPVLWTRHSRFTFEGEICQQLETFFLGRVSSWNVDSAGFTDLERRCVLGHRWWTLAQLQQTRVTVYPSSLAALLTELLRKGPPVHPLEVGP